MSINHGHVCSKSFLTRSHLWLFNCKQKMSQQKRSADGERGFLRVRSAFRAGPLPPAPSRSHQDPVRAGNAASGRGDTDVPAVPSPGGLPRVCEPQERRSTLLSVCWYPPILHFADLVPLELVRKGKRPSKLLDKLSHIYWMRFISTTKKF